MHYVYIIKSHNNRVYTGSTADLKQRIIYHNKGQVPHTSKNKPWKVIWYCAFPTQQQALDFERYLKSGSGHAFSRKRLI
ncbi:MAG: GIY-YIG nuclease family protein [Patescibacteria group bacterium]